MQVECWLDSASDVPPLSPPLPGRFLHFIWRVWVWVVWGAPLAPPCFFLLIVECSGKLTLSLLKVSGHDVGFFLGLEELFI